LLDDRRGGRRDRDGHERAERKKTASPPPKKKEATPDLTDVVPILQRNRRLRQWDIKPPGYENVTAEQAKLSGMFPLPGAPRQQPMDATRMQAFLNNPQGAATTTALKTTNARQSKRLFVYNLPPGATNESIVEFFNLQLNGLNVIMSNDPCASAQIADDQQFALLEFKHPEDATMAIALDGISMSDENAMDESNGHHGGLSIQRPKDYIVPAVSSDESERMEGVLSNYVKDTQNKLCISKIPEYLGEEEVLQLLKPIGELAAFVLVKYTDTEQSKVSNVVSKRDFAC
jgi:splicing factor U2AF 65 kDa subunit